MSTDPAEDQLQQRLASLSPAKQRLLEARLQQKAVAPEAKQTIPRRPKLEVTPPSFAQQRLWVIHNLEPDVPMYNMPKVLRLKGPLNIVALKQALEALIGRHEVLRTTLKMVDEALVQIIAQAWSVELPLIDLSAWSPQEREPELKRLLFQETYRPFDLSQELMTRGILFRLGEDEHIFLLVSHHIASDHWSTSIFSRELEAFYKAFAEGSPVSLPDLPIQYADFALWQREWLRGEVLEQQLAYWRQRLAGDLPALDLPTDRPRSKVQTYAGARKHFLLPQALTDALKALSRQEQVTLFMTMLAAFKLLLFRYTGQEDLLIGAPIAGRRWVETEPLVGFFINTLVLRTDLSGQPTFLELLKRVRQTTLGAYAHQDLPFEKLVEELQPERDLSRPPFFQVMFDFLNTPEPVSNFSGLQVQRLDFDKGIALYDLTLYLSDRAGALSGFFEYNTDLFEAATIERMIGHFQTLLEGIVAHPEQPVTQLPLLTEAERRQVLVTWNETTLPYSRDQTLPRLFELQVKRTPEATALFYQAQRLSYRELNEQANRLAHTLLARGVGPESLVGICMERSPQMVISLLAILKAGGAYVPLDPAYPEERLKFILEDTRASIVLTEQTLVARLPQGVTQYICLDSDEGLLSQGETTNPASKVQAQHLAYIIYTSGSTGKPKGVAIEHRNAVAFLAWAAATFTAEELSGVLASTSICFDLSVFELFGPLTLGGTVILAENVLAVPSLAAASTIKLINTVPSAMAELLQLGGLPASTCTVNLAGEPLPVSLVQHLYALDSVQRVYDLYGPSEDTTYSTWVLRRKDGPATIGRPIANTQAYILDRYLQPVPVGVPGELYLGGAGLARGYLNRPELTQARFIPHPFNPEAGARLYKTGDLARYLPDGNIEFLGRIDHQVKLRGYRIELGEIETIVSQYPGVRQTLVLVWEDSGGDKHLVAYVTSETPPAATDLRRFLQQKLPPYMVPAFFIFLEAFPLTPNGKLDRRALPRPDGSRAHLEQGYEAPQAGIETVMAGLWAELLRLDQVGRHDNFFEIGGHSLSATRLFSRLRDTFKVEIPLRTLFEGPTVAQLAQHIEQLQQRQKSSQPPAIVPVPRSAYRLKPGSS